MMNPLFSRAFKKIMLQRFFLGAAVSLFLSDPATADGRGNSCEPRSNVDAGRLNVAVDADGYGLMPPCRGKVSLYIAKNSSLRSIEGVLRLSMFEGDNLSTENLLVDFRRTDYGMFAADVSLGPVSDITCRSLSVGLEIRNCRGDGGGIIECPEIRVRAPQMFAGLEVSGGKLNICHDD